MSAINKRDKQGAIKKIASKKGALVLRRTSSAVSSKHFGRRTDHIIYGQTEFIGSKVSVISRLRAIGNSRGVILNSQLIKVAGLNTEADIVIQANDGVINIKQAKVPGINTDLSTWDKQFKAAIRKGARPAGDLFEGIANDFDSKEW